MIKALLAPVQKWLIHRGNCVGCGMPLAKCEETDHPSGKLIKCKCGRCYIKNSGSQYRRALMSELG